MKYLCMLTWGRGIYLTCLCNFHENKFFSKMKLDKQLNYHILLNHALYLYWLDIKLSYKI